MAVSTAPADRLTANLKVVPYDHDPAATTAVITSPDGGTTIRTLDMRDYKSFMAVAMTTIAAANGLQLLEIVAATDEEPGNSCVDQERRQLAEAPHLELAARLDSDGERTDRNQGLPDDESDGEPGGEIAGDEATDDRRGHSESVGKGVEELAELADLVEATRQVPVNPIGGADHTQQPARSRRVVAAEQQPQEDGDEEQSNE